MYFFNKYHATLKNDDPKKDISQTFYVTKNKGITTKEAFNLLSGRSVNKDLSNKEGESFNAWLQLDLKEQDKNGNHLVKQYHKAYGYDLDTVLKNYPIKELGNETDKNNLMKSLEKGNRQQVTFVKEGKEERMYIEANPQFKTLDLYDARMQKQFQGKDRAESHDTNQSNEKKESLKAEVDDEGDGKMEKRKSRRRGVGV
jgi:hypothetical protein